MKLPTHRIKDYEYALPSLIYSVLLGVTTTIHHLHSGLILHPQSNALHIVYNEMILIPAIILSMYFFLKTKSKIALWIYCGIAAAGFFILGLYEGGWNHSAKLIAYLRLDNSCTDIRAILPANNPDLWFYEITGVLTFISSMVASRYTWLFYREVA